jgi:rubrerythrin
MEFTRFMGIVEDLERAAADLYAHLGRCIDEEDVRSVFQQLAREEEAHVSQVQFQIKIASREPGKFKPVELDPAPAEKLMRSIRGWLMTEGQADARKAVRMALTIERQMSERYRALAIRGSNPGFSSFVSAMQTAEDAHTQLLIDLGKRYGYLED